MQRETPSKASRAVLRGGACALATAALLSGCGSSSGDGESAATRRSQLATERDPGRWIGYDAASRTAQITLELGYDEYQGGLNIDGAVKGALLFSVPSGWTVRVRCLNEDEARRYSCVLARAPAVPIVDRQAVDVLHPTNGLGFRQQKVFSFQALRATRYRLVAVTKGNAPPGMWVALSVASGGRPSARWLR
ncbi:MAG: sulfocyanin-like copper-binding protein [Solirubrobacteraceae bacterium]